MKDYSNNILKNMGFEYKDRLSQAANDGEERDESPAAEKSVPGIDTDLPRQEKPSESDTDPQGDLFDHAPVDKTPYDRD